LAAAKAKQIEQWEKAIKVASEPATSGDITVAEFYKTKYLPWLEAQVATDRKKYSTLVSAKRYWGCYCADFFADKRFSTFEPYVGRQWLESLRKDDGSHFGEATLRHIHAVCSAVFARAISTGFAGTIRTDKREVSAINPWHSIKVSQAPQINAEQGEAFTEAQVLALFSALEKEKPATTETRASKKRAWDIELAKTVISVGWGASMRPSEIACLRWTSIDWEKATITVMDSFVYGKQNSEPKTGKTRVVPFQYELTPILRAWWELNGKPDSGWVFPNSKNKPVSMNDLSSRIIQPMCDRAGVTWAGLTFYGLRRGGISRWVKSGWLLHEVAQAAGNSVQVIERHYYRDDKCELAAGARERVRQANAGVSGIGRGL
jgi:integrase